MLTNKVSQSDFGDACSRSEKARVERNSHGNCRDLSLCTSQATFPLLRGKAIEGPESIMTLPSNPYDWVMTLYTWCLKSTTTYWNGWSLLHRTCYRPKPWFNRFNGNLLTSLCIIYAICNALAKQNPVEWVDCNTEPIWPSVCCHPSIQDCGLHLVHFLLQRQ
jgi:hypothetical protein